MQTRNIKVIFVRYIVQWISRVIIINILGPRQNGPQFHDDIFKCIFLNDNI